jgi:hypothetical protein
MGKYLLTGVNLASAASAEPKRFLRSVHRGTADPKDAKFLLGSW